MDTVRINPLIVSVSPTDHTLISPIQPTMHKGGIGKLLSIAAAIAIPFAAPAIAGSIAASGFLSAGMTTFMTTVGGEMMVGAALGAISAKVQGQNVLAGAFMGGATTGLASYTGANDFSGTSGTEGGIGAAGGGGTGTSYGTRGLGNTSIDYGLGGVSPVDAVFGPATPAIGNAAGNAAANAAAKQTLGELMKETGKTVLSKLTSSTALANMTLMAAGNLLGQYLVPPGSIAEMSPEEAANLKEYQEELKVLKATDEDLFNKKIELAKTYMVQAGQIDPRYFANQAANESKITSAKILRDKQEQAALGNYGISDGEQARAGIYASKVAASKFDEGFGFGTGLRDSAQAKAMAAIPAGAPTSYIDGLSSIDNKYAGLRTQADTERANIQGMTAGLNLNAGNTGAEEDGLKEIYK